MAPLYLVDVVKDNYKRAGDVGEKSNFPDRNNPMCTSTILAIQGVSRKRT
jgi:hypothetical protein